MDYGYFWHDPKSVRLICSSVICLKRSYPVQRRRCVFNRTCLVFKINCGSKIENVKETQAVQLRTLQVWTCRPPRPPLDAHTLGRCALPRTEWTDAEWRWRWERRCGVSLQTFPPECFTSLWPRRLWRAASCGEPAPCGHCAQPPPCPPVRPGNIDNGDGSSASATCAAMRNGWEKLAVLWESSVATLERFLNFSITLKIWLKLNQIFVKVVFGRINHQTQDL